MAKMPDKPTLLDFFELRMGPAMHLLQSATHALQSAGCNEKIILACLLHDIAVTMFIRGDHGYWGSALVAPYVDEEVSVGDSSAHQALRFYPRQSVRLRVSRSSISSFSAMPTTPEPYIQRANDKLAREHKWYETARLITVNDIYSFDPTMNGDAWIRSATSSRAISGSPRKVWAGIIVRHRTCGARSTGRRASSDRADRASAARRYPRPLCIRRDYSRQSGAGLRKTARRGRSITTPNPHAVAASAAGGRRRAFRLLFVRTQDRHGAIELNTPGLRRRRANSNALRSWRSRTVHLDDPDPLG